MRLLLDTHLLLWAANEPSKLSRPARSAIENPDNQLVFSAASIWEIAIKSGMGRDDFRVDPRLLRRGLIDNGYEELAVRGDHALAVLSLPPLHKDPFDRLLIAQAISEGITLLTADSRLSEYAGPIQLA